MGEAGSLGVRDTLQLGIGYWESGNRNNKLSSLDSLSLKNKCKDKKLL